MNNPAEDWMIRQLDRHRRLLAEAKQRVADMEVHLAVARQTWRELCWGNRVYDIALYRKAAEAFILAKEARDGAREIAIKADELTTDED